MSALKSHLPKLLFLVALGTTFWLMARAEPTLKPAVFVPGDDIKVLASEVGAEGATLLVTNSGTPVDGVSVQISKGALTRSTTVTLSYNTGKIFLNHGEASGAYLRIAADGVTEFKAPVMISVRYDASRWKGYSLAGYAIDDKNLLSGVDSGNKDGAAGSASFYTLVPILFTWVYAR